MAKRKSIADEEDKVKIFDESDDVLQCVLTEQEITHREQEKKDTHYVDKDEFSAEMDDYSRRCKIAKAAGEPRPEISESIAKKFVLIATGLSRRPNWCSYTWKADMISEAVFTCCKYAHSYDPTKSAAASSGAFSYFNKICNQCFITVLDQEKKQGAIKFAAIANSDHFAKRGRMGSDEADYRQTRDEYLATMQVNYTPRKKRPKKKDSDITTFDV